MERERNESVELERRIAELSEEVRKRRVEEGRKRETVVREYEGILRKLEEELSGGDRATVRGVNEG